jgi:ATP synthase protein I
MLLGSFSDRLHVNQSRWPDEVHESEVHEPLTAQQAEVLKQKLGSIKLEDFLIRVTAWQLFAGVLMGILVWLVWREKAMAITVFYGAMCAVLPSALVGFVLKRRMSTGVLKHSGDMLLGLFVLELIKVVAAICLLLAAPLVLGSPHWVAVVAGFVLTLKIYWLVALSGLRQTGHVHTLR